MRDKLTKHGVNNMKIIKYDIKECIPKNKGSSEIPYIKLAGIISEATGVPVEELNVSNYGASVKDQERLKKYTGRWVRKAVSYLEPGTKRFETQVSMLHLNYSPRDCEFVRDGYIIYRDSWEK